MIQMSMNVKLMPSTTKWKHQEIPTMETMELMEILSQFFGNITKRTALRRREYKQSLDSDHSMKKIYSTP